ncbi:MAG: phage major capsid protein [Azospirillum sp.]|nr:phage major capsid protein [Azospirillum sp.]
MSVSIQALREERNAKAKEARNLLDSNTGDAWTPAIKAEFDALAEKIENLDQQIERHERVIQLEAGLKDAVEDRAVKAGKSVDQVKHEDARERKAFSRWIQGGMDALDAEGKELMAKRAVTIQANQSVGTGSAGGFSVPPSFLEEIEIAMLAYGNVQGVSRVIRSAIGSDLAVPALNDTNNTGRIIAENAALTNTALVLSQVNIPAFMYSSDSILMSYQMLQDSILAEGEITRLIGERLGRITNAHFTTGTGTGQPRGVVTASSVGRTGATGTTVTATYNDLVLLQESVDEAYQQNARWMFHQSTRRMLKQLVDTAGRPLWQPGVSAGLGQSEPDTILGKPYTINNQMAVMAANARSILYGDFSKYYVRVVRDMQMRRLDERYADNLQVGFFAFGRWGGNLVDAGTNPIRCFVNSAT